MLYAILALWFIAALLSLATAQMALLFVSSFILACAYGIIGTQFSRAFLKLKSLARVNTDISASSMAGFVDLIQSLEYRLNTMEWEAKAASEATLVRGEILAEAEPDQFTEAEDEFLSQILETASRQFRAKASALVVFDRSGEMLDSVYTCGLGGKRFESQLLRMVEAYLQRHDRSVFGLVELSHNKNLSADFSIFGFGSSVCFPLSEEHHSGVLWLGYSPECAPLESEIILAKDFARKVGSELQNSRKVIKLKEQVVSAESRDRQKDEFISHMSHDIRSPLNNIRSILSLFKVQGFSEDTPEMIEVALSNCQSLTELVEDILDFSKHQAGRLAANPSVFELNGVVAGIIESYVVMARLKKLELRLKCSPGDVFVVGDVRHIKRAVTNILSNALKYTRQGFVEVQVDAPTEHYWSVKITDSGIGMSKEQLNKLFTPFTTFNRVKTGSKEDRKGISTDGIGLGLALSKILIDMSGGQIRVDSKFGEGSIFEILLPASMTAEAPMRAQREFKAGATPMLAEADRNKEAVLLVDDDIDCVDSLGRYFECKGFRVLKATGVHDAVGIINYETPRIIISDSAMPDGGLKRILRHIRKSGIFCSLAVLSGTVGPSEKEAYFAQGAAAVFAKPADLEALAEWIAHEIWMLNEMRSKQHVA